MEIIADLHIHSRYSMATSKLGTPEYLDLWARKKGISLVGTGDFTHPAWREELKEKLVKRKDMDCELEEARARLVNQETFSPFCEHILDSYRKSKDPVYKNTLLKLIIKRIDYTKNQRGGRDGERNDQFELTIHVKLEFITAPFLHPALPYRYR